MKNINSRTVALSSALILASSLIACSKGSSQYAGVLLSKKCEAGNMLNLAKVNKTRKIKISESLAGANSAAEQYVLRTYLVQDVTSKAEISPTVEDAKLLASQKSAADESFSADEPTLNADCATLDATYTGPGVTESLTGKLEDITSKSVTMVALDKKNKVRTTVMVERAELPSKMKEAYKAALEKEKAGLSTLLITVKREQDAETRVLKFRQETVLNQEMTVEIEPSALTKTVLLAQASDELAIEKMTAIQLYDLAIAEKQKSLHVAFSDLLALRDFVLPKVHPAGTESPDTSDATEPTDSSEVEASPSDPQAGAAAPKGPKPSIWQKHMNK